MKMYIVVRDEIPLGFAIRNVVPDVPAADGVIDALIQLTMQLVFEDGIMRWEFL